MHGDDDGDGDGDGDTDGPAYNGVAWLLLALGLQQQYYPFGGVREHVLGGVPHSEATGLLRKGESVAGEDACHGQVPQGCEHRYAAR